MWYLDHYKYAEFEGDVTFFCVRSEIIPFLIPSVEAGIWHLDHLEYDVHFFCVRREIPFLG